MTSVPIMMSWQRKRLVNEALASYLEWRQECSAVSQAYSRWTSGRASEAPLSYAAYAAALEREERASELYAGVVAHVAKILGAAPALTSARRVAR